MKTKNKLFKVSLTSCTSYTCSKPTSQAAVRNAIKYWISQGELKKQPRTLDDGEFEGVEVEILV